MSQSKFHVIQELCKFTSCPTFRTPSISSCLGVKLPHQLKPVIKYLDQFCTEKQMQYNAISLRISLGYKHNEFQSCD